MPELTAPVDETAHDSYESYALEEEELSVPEDIGGEDRDGAVLRASSSAGLDLQPLFACITALAGENVSAQRDLAERDARIKAP